MTRNKPDLIPESSPKSDTEILVQDEATQHYTPHQSRHDFEGRRNQPRNASPKHAKRRRAAKHIAEAEAKAEMGVLAPFATPSLTLDELPKIY